MLGKLNRFLHGVRRLAFWHLVGLLFMVALGLCLTLLVLGLKTEKEYTETDMLWVPGNVTSMYALFGVYPQFGSDSQGMIPWKDTHTSNEYQKLDAAVNFFVLTGSQIRYLAVLYNAGGTVSVARTTVSPKIPGKGFWEERTVSFDPVTGQVTAHYVRSPLQILTVGILFPFAFWILVSVLIGIIRGLKWNDPVFPLKRVPT